MSETDPIQRAQAAQRRARFDVLALEHERKQKMQRLAQHRTVVVPEHLHATDITASRINTGMLSGYRRPGYSQHLAARMSGTLPSTDSSRHVRRGANYAIAVGASMILTAFIALLPLWAIGVAAVVLGVAVYLGVLTADVCRTMIPASEVEQRKIDWIVNRELPALPDRYTCLDCGNFPEDCVCDSRTGKPKVWTEPCADAVQMIGQQHDRCALCDFLIHDH
jgi:hypothetical protein